MKFYDISRPLYLETDASGVSLGAGLQQVRKEMNCGCNDKPDNEILHPTVFVSRSILSMDWWYSNIQSLVSKSFTITVLPRMYA